MLVGKQNTFDAEKCKFKHIKANFRLNLQQSVLVIFVAYPWYKVWLQLLEVILSYSMVPFEVLARKGYRPAVPFRLFVPWLFRGLVGE